MQPRVSGNTVRHQGWGRPLHGGYRACFVSVCAAAIQKLPLVHICNSAIKSWFQSPRMSMGIRSLQQHLGTCTASCSMWSPTKGGALHKEHSSTRPKTTGASHALLVADPYRAVLSQTANLPASRERQTNAFLTARCGGHTKPVLFQDKTTGTMRHGSGFTNPQSLMSQFHVTPGPVPHGELPGAKVPLPTPGMPSRLLSSALPRSRRATQLSSPMETIPAAHAHQTCLSAEIHTHSCWAESPRGHATAGHCEQKGKKRIPGEWWGRAGTHSHSCPRWKWSYFQVGFQENSCCVICNCTSFSPVRCAVLAENTLKLLHRGFIPYCNERHKAIKLSPYKKQIYLLHWAKCMDVATSPISTEEGYSRQFFCTNRL